MLLAIFSGLAQVYESVKPASDNIGRLLWLSLGAQTTQLIHENIHVGEVQKSLRKALLKYKLYKDQVLFVRAYAYIKEYYSPAKDSLL